MLTATTDRARRYAPAPSYHDAYGPGRPGTADAEDIDDLAEPFARLAPPSTHIYATSAFQEPHRHGSLAGYSGGAAAAAERERERDVSLSRFKIQPPRAPSMASTASTRSDYPRSVKASADPSPAPSIASLPPLLPPVSLSSSSSRTPSIASSYASSAHRLRARNAALASLEGGSSSSSSLPHAEPLSQPQPSWQQQRRHSGAFAAAEQPPPDMPLPRPSADFLDFDEADETDDDAAASERDFQARMATEVADAFAPFGAYRPPGSGSPARPPPVSPSAKRASTLYERDRRHSSVPAPSSSALYGQQPRRPTADSRYVVRPPSLSAVRPPSSRGGPSFLHFDEEDY